MERVGHKPTLAPLDGLHDQQEIAGFIPALKRFFTRQTRDVQIVDDLVQDVMMRMHARSDSTSVENLPGYIFHTASSVLRDQYRKDRVRQIMVTTDFSEFDVVDEESSPERVIEDRDELNNVIAALNELSERTRDVFLLRRFEGLAYGEIADRTGLSVSSLEKHVAKAAAHLARRIGR